MSRNHHSHQICHSSILKGQIGHSFQQIFECLIQDEVVEDSFQIEAVED